MGTLVMNGLSEFGSVRRLIAAAEFTRRRQLSKIDGRLLRQLIAAAEQDAAPRNVRLQELLRRSAQVLFPLGDPLMVEFGLHRWLRAGREEAYSDWLAWIIGHLGTASRVFDLLGIRNDEVLTRCGPNCPVWARESRVSEGFEGKAGRTDIQIKFGAVAVVLVEIKMGRESGTEKQLGYVRSLKTLVGDRLLDPILICREEDSETPRNGYFIRSWNGICIRLRRVAAELIRHENQHIVAAMTLAFTGAIEQNILGYSAPIAQAVLKPQVAVVPSTTADQMIRYLESWLAAEEGHERLVI
jgi:hypothetical protein